MTDTRTSGRQEEATGGARRPTPFWANSGLWLAVLMAVQLISYSRMLSGTLLFNEFNRDDTETYVSLGHSIANGRGYTDSLDSSEPVPHRRVTPGFPLLLAGAFLPTDSVMPAQIMIILFSLANALLLFWLARQFLPGFASLTCVALTVCSPIYDQFSTVLMTEQPLTFFFLLSALSLYLWTIRGCRLDRWFAMAIFSLGFGMLVKPTIGVLIPAWLLWLCFGAASRSSLQRRLGMASILVTIALTPTIWWSVHLSHVPAQGPLGTTQVEDLLTAGRQGGASLRWVDLARIASNNVMWFVPKRLLDALGGSGWFSEKAFSVILPAWLKLCFVGTAVIGLGWALLNFRKLGFIALAVSFLCLLLPFHYQGGNPRYWLVVHPLMLIILLAGLSRLFYVVCGPHRGLRILGPALLTSACLGALCILVLDHIWREPQRGQVWRALADMAQQAGTITPENAVIVSHNSNYVRFVSHRFSSLKKEDVEALDGRRAPARPVYVILPTEQAFAEHHRTVETLPGHPVEAARNQYYTLFRLCVQGRD